MTSVSSSRRSISPSFASSDWSVIAVLMVFVIGLSWVCLHSSRLPFEDAAMLMRYAGHLAQGHGIVWNIGEKPVDGATDFLFLIALAGVVRSGLSLENAVIFLGVVSHMATTLLIYATLRFLKTNRVLSLVTALLFAVGPGLFLVRLFFGTPFFALFCALSWALALLLWHRPGPCDLRLSLAFSLSCLLMTLTRPEGVFLTFFMAVALAVFRPWKEMRPLISSLLVIFVVGGGAYFVWHWMVFGFPLPNPYYKKGGGHFYPGSLVGSVLNTFALLEIFLPVFVAGLVVKTARAFTIFCGLPLALFTGIWILLSDEMNHLARFQYALFPLICLSWPLVLNKVAQDPLASQFRHKRALKIGGAVLLCLAGLHAARDFRAFWMQTRNVLLAQQNFQTAHILARYSNRGYTLATTEAGIIPLYSGWRSIDLWGLNDSWIAHNGGVTARYLAQIRPHVLVIHAPFEPEQTQGNAPPRQWNPSVYPLGRGWFEMCATTEQFARRGGFRLVACRRDEAGGYALYFWVSPHFPDSHAIGSELHRALDNTK